MFCRNCGSQLPDNAAFCGNCGTKVEAVAAAPQQPAYEAVQQPAPAQEPVFVAPQQPVQAPPKPAVDPYLDDLAGSVLARGITGLILAFVGIPGIIVSAKAKNLAAEYERKAGQLSGRAKVGSILAKVGFPVGWGMTAFYVLYAIILMAAMM